MTGADPIVAPTGQLLPGGLRALGIGAIPSNAPAVPADLEPPAPSPPMPDQAAAALLPPPNLAPPPGAAAGAPQIEAPAEALPPPTPAHPFGTSPALLSYLQGRQPPPGVDPLTGQEQPAPAPVGETPPTVAAPAQAGGQGAKTGKGAPQPAQPAPPPQVPAAGPAGMPPTLGQAYEQTQNAAAAQIGAVANEADVAAKQADVAFKAREDADKVLQTAQEQLRARIERDQEVLGQKQAAVEAANKELDNYKIDPHRFWKGEGTAKKVGWFISMALSGIGDALQGKGGPNPVIGMLQNTIENDVKLQMDQRDALRAKAQRAGQALDSADRFSQNRFAQEQYMLAQAYTMAGRQIETAAAKYGSEAARAQGASAAAAIYGKAAEAGQKAAEYATTDQRQREQLAEQKRASMAQVGLGYSQLAEQKRSREAQIGLGYAQLGETQRHNMAGEAIDQEKEELKAALSAAKANGKSPDELKVMRERAIGGEITPVKDEKGKLVGYRKGLMTTASGDVWVPTGTEASVTKLQDQHAAATALIQTLDKIRAIGPEWLSDTANSDKKRKLDQLMGDARLQAIAAKGLGVPTGHDIELAENFLGTSDPTKARNQLAGIMQSRESIVRDHNVLLQTHGYDKEWNPADPVAGAQAADPAVTAADALFKERTPAELGAAAQGSLIRRTAPAPVADALQIAGYGRTDRNVEERASSKYPGLTPEQEPQMDALIAQANGRDADAAERARAAIATAVKDTYASRPAIGTAVLNVLKTEAPKAYQQVVEALPDEVRTQRQDLDLGVRQAQMQSAKTEDVIKAYRKADPVAWDELQRRATTDPKAAAIMTKPQSTAGVADLERLASGGDALARQELARRAYGEIQRKGTPTSQAEVDKLPAYSALLRIQGGATK